MNRAAIIADLTKAGIPADQAQRAAIRLVATGPERLARFEKWAADKKDWTRKDYEDEGRTAFDGIPKSMKPSEANRELFAQAYAQIAGGFK